MCIKLPCGYSTQTLAKIIAHIEITVYVLGIIFFALFGVVLESRADLLKEAVRRHDGDSYSDVAQFLDLEPVYRTCLVLWMILNFVAGAVISVVLLQGAQERNHAKVKIWFVVTILGYALWIPIIALWIWYSSDPVNVGCSALLCYMFAALCLWIVHAFMTDVYIESRSGGYRTVGFAKI